MAIPAKAIGGGNTSTASNVFRTVFSQSLSAAPTYQMWDNGSTFPAVDASGATVVKEAFTGTAGNSNKPEYALVDTTNAAPTSVWLPSTATGGAANPNRMKGSTNSVTSPATPTLFAVPGTASAATAAGSNLGVGTYKYQITFITGIAGLPLGETNGGTEFSITTTGGNTNVSLTGIPLGPAGTIKRSIYRTQVGGSTGTERLVTTIGDNTTTTYTDSTTDATIVAATVVPTTNTTAAIRYNITAEFASDSAVPSTSSQSILLQIGYQYTGTAPSLTYFYNDSGTGTDAAPNWVAYVPGTNGIRLVNTGTSAGTYKYTLPSSSVQSVGNTTGELWVTT
jgi:hypothetical protein